MEVGEKFNMYTQKQKTYYAIVSKKTGKLLLLGGHLPIYWRKKVAEDISSKFSSSEVVPVSGDEVQKLLRKDK